MDTHGCAQSPGVVRFAALAAALVQGVAPAAGADVPTPTTSAPASTCPDPERVWAIVVHLVPGAAAELLAAKSRVTLDDFGDQYHVRVALEGASLERTYADSARDCGKRARFAAEFVVIALSPPSLTPGEAPPSAASAPSVPTPAPVPRSDVTPSLAAVPAPRAVPSRAPMPAPTATSPPGPVPKSPLLRFELAATMDAAPPVLGAPATLSWGANLRVRVGRGPLSAISGVGYSPMAGFGVDDFRGAVTRVPAVLGVRARFPIGRIELDADLGGAVAVERYEGVSPQMPNHVTRIAVGAEAAVIASVPGFAGLAPFAAFRCAFYPGARELATAPQGIIGKTPSVWVGAALGMSFEP